MGIETKPEAICPQEDIQLVSKEDVTLGYVGFCKKLQGRCAYFNNPGEFKKIDNRYENCFIYKNINK
ncbi:MAG: hypothetical protein ACM3X9_14175 [Bacillota bacterium]